MISALRRRHSNRHLPDGITTIVLMFLMTGAAVLSAPLSLKEIEFLVRQGTPEAEIVAQARSRRLGVPLDAAAVASLKKQGASDSLIAKLTSPGIALDQQAAAIEARRQAAMKARLDALLAEDLARKERRDREWNKNAEQLRKARTIQGWLRDKVFTLQKKAFKPIEPKSLDPVSIFGFFHGAMSSAPSRDFAPQLAEAYARLKKQYGDDFEIIFVSHDRDEYNQREFLRTSGLTCPTMKASDADPSIFQYGGERPPWFVLVADNGTAVSLNGDTKQFVEPIRVLSGLEQLLAALHR